MNRLLILVAVLAFFLAACGTQTADDATATLTPEPTVAATEAPDDTDEPAATDDDDGGMTGSLDDVIPDELNGVAGTPIPGLDQILGQALQGQGIDAEDAEFAFVTYGEGAEAVVLNAFRIPGVTEAQLALLGQLMSGAGGAGEVEATTEEIGGKTVLSFSGGGQEGVVYVYIVDDVAFTVAGQDASAVEQLLSELP